MPPSDVETAGSAVVTSGLTVVVGFAALVTTPLSDTRSVGVGGLFVVGVAVLLATTFLPAVLAILGATSTAPSGSPARSPVPRADRLGALGAVAGPSAVARSRGRGGGHRPPDLPPQPDPPRSSGPPIGFPPESESGMGLEALREMGASGVIQTCSVSWCSSRKGESALSARRPSGAQSPHGLDPQGPARARGPGRRQARHVDACSSSSTTATRSRWRAKNPKFLRCVSERR